MIKLEYICLLLVNNQIGKRVKDKDRQYSCPLFQTAMFYYLS